MGRPSRFSPEVRERAVRMVEEHREAHASEWAVLQSVAPKLGCTAETLRKWVRQAQRDAGHRLGLPTSERERLKELEREVRELKRANEILRKAFAYFAQAELDRRRTSPRWSSSSPTIAPCSGSSRSAPCCRSPRRRTRRHRHQRTHPTRRSARAQRDDQLRVEIQRVYDAHQQVYGPRKVWKQRRRDDGRVARCTVARLMRAMGLAGAVRGRAWVTTPHAGEGGRPVDLVDRRFVATRPNQLWVSDFTYVATWGGFVYVAFVIDVCARRSVGWRVSASMRTDFVLDALEQAIYARRGDALTGLVHHRDAGSQYLSMRYTDRLVDAGIAPSVGSQGNAYDHALAESVIGLYKTEVIRRKGPWRTLEAVEFATLTWVDWFNTRRLLGPLGDLPPAELEAQYYEQAEVA